MSKIYAMSDIHGHYDEFIESLSKVDLSDADNRLILLGDYIDGGSQSFQVISKIIELEKKFPDQVITLLGNHEEYFSEWLFEEDGGSKYTSYDTIISFIGQNKRKNIVDTVVSDFSISDEECLVQINKKIRDCVTSEYPAIVDWFRNKYYNSERFYETDNQIFVHAGVDEELGENWKLYSNPDILLINFQQVSDIFIRILFQDILLLQRSQMTQAISEKSTMTKKVIILLMVVLVKVILYPFFVIIPSLNHITTRRVTVGVDVNDFCPMSLTETLNNNT